MATTGTRTRRKASEDGSVTVSMSYDKETSRTIRYKEDSETPRIGVLYVPKSTLNEMGDPQEITVSIAPVA